jgi:hypothetical protein
MEEQIMANNQFNNDETMSEEIAENSGMRAAAVNSDPTISLEEARNAAAGEGPNAAGGPAASSAEDYVPSRSDPDPTNIPSTDHPLPDDAENPDEDTLGDSKSRSEKSDDRYVH